jgi:hypothetical protein
LSFRITDYGLTNFFKKININNQISKNQTGQFKLYKYVNALHIVQILRLLIAHYLIERTNQKFGLNVMCPLRKL